MADQRLRGMWRCRWYVLADAGAEDTRFMVYVSHAYVRSFLHPKMTARQTRKTLEMCWLRKSQEKRGTAGVKRQCLKHVGKHFVVQ